MATPVREGSVASSANSNKRQCPSISAGVNDEISTTQSLATGFSKVRRNIELHDERSANEIAHIKAQLDKLEEVFQIQETAWKRDLVAKNAQVKDMDRQLTKLREASVLYNRTLESARSRAESWMDKHAEVYKTNEALRADAAAALAARDEAQTLLAPHTRRLAELKEMAQRVHDSIIRRVQRIAVLEKQKGAAGTDKAARARRAQELGDQEFVLAKAWEDLEEEYMEVMHEGLIDDQGPGFEADEGAGAVVESNGDA